MRKITLLPALVALLAVGTYALDGRNGSTVTSHFTATGVAANVEYPPGFSGVRWNDPSILYFDLGPGGGLVDVSLLAAGAGGDLFFTVFGRTEPGTPRYKGLIQWTGTRFVHLIQDTVQRDNATGISTGSVLHGVTVSSVTAGLLTAGHPVFVRHAYPEGGGTQSNSELWSVDPTTSPATQSLVHRLGSGGTSHAVIDAGGAMYVGGSDITKLTFNGSGYDESVLATGFHVDERFVLGTDGALYAFSGDTIWNQRRKGSNSILRIDTDTGATSVHASVSQKFTGFLGWAWSGDGRLWICLNNGSADIVTEVRAGETVNTPGIPVSETPRWLTRRAMAGGPGGEVYVTEWQSHLAGAVSEVFELEPAADTGGGPGGGKGKGKNK